MKTMKKRVLASILALVMIVSVVQTAALAADAPVQDLEPHPLGEEAYLPDAKSEGADIPAGNEQTETEEDEAAAPIHDADDLPLEPVNAPLEGTVFQIFGEDDLKKAVRKINAQASGVFTLSLQNDITVERPMYGDMKIFKNKVTLLGNGFTITYGAKLCFGGGLGATGSGILNLGRSDGSDWLTITARGSQEVSLIESESGGTVNMYPGVTLTGNEYTGNQYTSGFGSGVGVGKNGTFNMFGGTISKCSNIALKKGGGVGMAEDGAVFNLYDGVIEENHALEDGGGIYVGGGTFNMYGGTVRRNKANCRGGGIFVHKAVFYMGDGVVDRNEAGDSGGGIYIESTDVTPPPILIDPTANPGEKTESGIPVCVGNPGLKLERGPFFGGISGRVTNNRICSCVGVVGEGAGIYIKNCKPFTISNLLVEHNTLKSGNIMASGILIRDSNGILIRDSDILKNSGGTLGAGIFLCNSANTSISNCTISENSGDGHGGGIYACLCNNLIISDSEISKNSSGSCGGGIAISGSSTCQIQNCVITGNSSQESGGGVHLAAGTAMALDKHTVLCNNIASKAGADVDARPSLYASTKPAAISLPDAAGMKQIYQADGRGKQIDGWYVDGRTSRYVPSETGTPVDVSKSLTGDIVLVASYRVKGYELTYDLNGGTQGSGPLAEIGLAPGTHKLNSSVRPTHPSVDGKPVVFVGWTAEADGVIHTKSSSAFSAAKLLTSVIISGDETVYALWGYDENGDGIPDVVERDKIIEVIPKDPALPFRPEDAKDGNNSQSTPEGYVRIIFSAGEHGTFGKYHKTSVDKAKVAYDVKKGIMWSELPIPVPVANAGYRLKAGAEQWAPQLPQATAVVVGGIYTAQYTADGGMAEKYAPRGRDIVACVGEEVSPSQGIQNWKELPEGTTAHWTSGTAPKTDKAVPRTPIRITVKYPDGTTAIVSSALTIKEDIVVVTFRIVNGTWDNGSTADQKVSVTLIRGKGTLTSDLVPIGMHPNRGYSNGSWDVKPDTSKGAVTRAVTYTYSFHRSGGGGGRSDGSTNGKTTCRTLHYESNGGTVYKDETYSSGAVVSLNKVPVREGYTFTGWYADKKLAQKIDSIAMKKNRTVYAGWEKHVQTPSLRIPALLNGDKHIAYIAGCPDGAVRPLSNITRAEVAVIFYRLLKENVRIENETARSTFADVPEDIWYCKAVSTIARLGIVTGRSTETFAPNAAITRAEFAALCARFDKSNVEGTARFSDIDTCWARPYIERAAALGWISGYSDGTFRPDNLITRGEIMCIINRMLGRRPERADDMLPGMKTWRDNTDTRAWYYLDVQEATNGHEFQRKGDGIHETWTCLLSPGQGMN